MYCAVLCWLGRLKSGQRGRELFDSSPQWSELSMTFILHPITGMPLLALTRGCFDSAVSPVLLTGISGVPSVNTEFFAAKLMCIFLTGTGAAKQRGEEKKPYFPALWVRELFKSEDYND